MRVAAGSANASCSSRRSGSSSRDTWRNRTDVFQSASKSSLILFFEHGVDGQTRGQEQRSDVAASGGSISDRNHVRVSGRKQLPRQTGPLLRDPAELFARGAEELEVPALPVAFHAADQVVL